MVSTKLTTDNDNPSSSEPDRIAIVCPVLQAEINRITGAEMNVERNVLVSPFELLAPHYEDFVEALSAKEAELEEMEEGIDNKSSSSGASGESAVEDEDGHYEESDCGEDNEMSNVQSQVNSLRCLLHLMDTKLKDQRVSFPWLR